MEIFPVKRFHTVQTFQTILGRHWGSTMMPGRTTPSPGQLSYACFFAHYLNPNLMSGPPRWTQGSLGFFISSSCQCGHTDYINLFSASGGPAQLGGDPGDQAYPQDCGRERVFAQSCISLWHPLLCDLHSPTESFKLGFSSIKVLIGQGHGVSGEILLVCIRKCLALNSKHIKDLTASFYEYEGLRAGMGLPNLISC